MAFVLRKNPLLGLMGEQVEGKRMGDIRNETRASQYLALRIWVEANCMIDLKVEELAKLALN